MEPLQDMAEPISPGWGVLGKTYVIKGRKYHRARGGN